VVSPFVAGGFGAPAALIAPMAQMAWTVQTVQMAPAQ